MNKDEHGDCKERGVEDEVIFHAIVGLTDVFF